jgi:hypothetical protein
MNDNNKKSIDENIHFWIALALLGWVLLLLARWKN